MKILLSLLALSSIATAGTCRVGWAAVAGATRYEVFCGSEWLATVTGTEAVVTLADDKISTLHVVAVNSKYRSQPSAPLHLLPWRPEFSQDLSEWQPGKVLYAPIPTANLPARAFVRAAFPTSTNR